MGMLSDDIIAIRYEDFLKYGCPSCGCDVVLNRGPFGGVGTCEECGQQQMFFDNETNESPIVFFKKGTGEPYSPKVQEHPRKGIPWHAYAWPDPRPDGGGEYWSPRGIGYDLSGFVKSKPAGERILTMVKEVLGKDQPASWLDWRPREPKWIQFKFQGEEFDLEKLEDLVLKNNKVITKEILEACVRKGDGGGEHL